MLEAVTVMHATISLVQLLAMSSHPLRSGIAEASQIFVRTKTAEAKIFTVWVILLLTVSLFQMTENLANCALFYTIPLIRSTFNPDNLFVNEI